MAQKKAKKDAALQVALDPNSSHEELVRISTSRRVEVLRAIVNHPNGATGDDGELDVNLFLRLARWIPDDVFESPVIQFLLMADDAGSVRLHALFSTIAERSTSEDNMRMLYGMFSLDEFTPASHVVLVSLAKNPLLPVDVLNNIARSRDWKIAEHALRNPAVSKELLVQTVESNSNIALEAAALENPSIPIKILRESAIYVMDICVRDVSSAYGSSKMHAFANPSMPEDLLLHAIGAKMPFFIKLEILSYIAKNPGMSEVVAQAIFDCMEIGILRNSTGSRFAINNKVSYALAWNPRTPPHIIAALTGRTESLTREIKRANAKLQRSISRLEGRTQIVLRWSK